MRRKSSITLVLAIAAIAASARAELRLPRIFGDHMVLQRESEVPLWGWAEPGAEVRVRAAWSANEIETNADANGAWRARVTTPEAGGPYTITISGSGEITLRDVLIGEVWLASGQSNMEFVVAPSSGHGGVEDAERELASATHPRIRMFTVAGKAAAEPQRDCGGAWIVCDPSTVGSFSAVAYFFERELERELDCPIGVISSCWGGTTAQEWVGGEALRPLKTFDVALDRLQRIARGGETPSEDAPVNHTTPSALFNGMIAPLIPFRVRGALWYQGESNVAQAEQYGPLFAALRADWRARWGQGEFPFYWVQIAPFRYAKDHGGAACLRDAQRRAIAPPNDGMACTLDIGNPDNVHPRNKREVGRRLSLWALANVYGRRELECSGPLFRALAVEGSSARLSFDHAASGLVAPAGELAGFELAGADRRFAPARARIDGATVIVASEQVTTPVAVRYAWNATAEASLFNGAGLPAPTFRSDTWPIE